MKRKEFIKLCGILGISIPIQTSLVSCSKESVIDHNFEGNVIIIGAGAGGLSAGYLLNQIGVKFQILEASNSFGGRMKINNEFADFPIPLGAEWLHTDKSVFNEIVNDTSINVQVDTISYNSQVDTYGYWSNGQLEVSKLNDTDIKFVNSTWFNFYEDYIVPPIVGQIEFNCPVKSIEYTNEKIKIVANNKSYEADKVIVCVPVKVLQDRLIEFIPTLPEEKLNVIKQLNIWEGFKAFLEFSEKFYHTSTEFEILPETQGQKLYYDAAYGQNSSKNILGLFTVGKPAAQYSSMTDQELKRSMLEELDEIYSGKASQSYVKHIAQDWNKDPYIRGGYISDYEEWQNVKKLSESVDNKIYFAGGAYTNGDDWVAVQTAANSAKQAVEELIK